MKSYLTEDFIVCFRRLLQDVQEKARKNYKLWQKNPNHRSLQFKRVHAHEPMYSVRIGIGWRRALGLVENGDIYWFWSGKRRYLLVLDRFSRRLRQAATSNLILFLCCPGSETVKARIGRIRRVGCAHPLRRLRPRLSHRIFLQRAGRLSLVQHPAYGREPPPIWPITSYPACRWASGGCPCLKRLRYHLHHDRAAINNALRIFLNHGAACLKKPTAGRWNRGRTTDNDCRLHEIRVFHPPLLAAKTDFSRHSRLNSPCAAQNQHQFPRLTAPLGRGYFGKMGRISYCEAQNQHRILRLTAPLGRGYFGKMGRISYFLCRKRQAFCKRKGVSPSSVSIRWKTAW